MIVGVDIGGTKIAVGAVDERGHLLARREAPTQAEQGFDAGVHRIVEMIRAVAAESGQAVQGVGVGCTGPVDPQSGRIGQVDFLPGWEGAPIAAAIEAQLRVPVVLENDADAAALGEWRWGSGRGQARTFLYVTISTGIGVGFIIDGHIYRGVDGAHPEIGHHVIDPTGPLCACGARGCWESLASGTAMARWFHENAPSHYSHKNLDARAICVRDDDHARAAIQRTARYLGLGLANLITLFIPEVIALGGGLMRSRQLFWPTIQQIIDSHSGYVPRHRVALTPARLGDDAGVIGAAWAWKIKQ